MYVKQVQSNHYYMCSYVKWRIKTKNLHEKKVIKICSLKRKKEYEIQEYVSSV
jgi:hypothetical protein